MSDTPERDMAHLACISELHIVCCILPGLFEDLRLEHSIGQVGTSVDCILIDLMLNHLACAYVCVLF